MPDVPPPAAPSVKKSRFRAPDTMTREQWDAMRNNLPDRIDEVMASFREEKLSVKPRAQAPQQEDDNQSTLFLLSDIPDPVVKRRWPWFVAGGAFCLAIAGWLLYEYSGPGSHQDVANSNAPVTKAITHVPIAPSPAEPIAAPADAALVAAPTAAAVKPEPPITSPSAPVITPERPAAKEMASAPVSNAPPVAPPAEAKPAAGRHKSLKAAKASPKAAHPAEEEVRTIEDLTPLLRGKDPKQP